ncbi:hypothetical protein LB531_21730 [Mesorhizobium sp. CO1-1-2]|uniref:hypothetical protein n=1 Tax=Mesorhizobium sp. CO1-1-2 TaxID=2876635 RepID=UPI001CCDABEC|nr:hypothetical protein [Mesorhizobium sp. CO1-1-2]MBZ9683282.1 hypothetical protein [Mesorhizobium sp. CO1-1-2]
MLGFTRSCFAIAVLIACPTLASADDLRVIAKQDSDHPCRRGDTPDIAPAWASRFCKTGGTGMSHCDDGKIVIEIDAQSYCHVTISEHATRSGKRRL